MDYNVLLIFLQVRLGNSESEPCPPPLARCLNELGDVERFGLSGKDERDLALAGDFPPF
jgi:hypothetical protein